MRACVCNSLGLCVMRQRKFVHVHVSMIGDVCQAWRAKSIHACLALVPNHARLCLMVNSRGAGKPIVIMLRWCRLPLVPL